VCVHPDRIGFLPGRYASGDDRWPDGTPAGDPPGSMPDDPAALAAWMIAVVRHAGPDVSRALADAEGRAAARFPTGVVVAALRQALGAL
jgi:hypothetical protein